MAAMTTALTEFSTLGDSRTYTTTGHTVQEPKVVVQKRKVPSGNQIVSESSVAVIHATEDSEGLILPQKVSITVTVRSPINGLTADVDAALVIFRDIVAGDEFANTVDTQEYLS
jgi:hypothetical protein